MPLPEEMNAEFNAPVDHSLLSVERHQGGAGASDAALAAQRATELHAGQRRAREEKMRAFRESLQRRLEEKECADQAAARESYREMRDAMVQMQVEADKLAEAQREALSKRAGGKAGPGARGAKPAKGKSLEHQVQQVLACADSARAKLLAHKGGGAAPPAGAQPTQPLEMRAAAAPERLPLADAVRDRERYNDALSQRIAQRCKAAGIKIPALCSCPDSQDTSPLDPDYVRNCANNCDLYGNSQLHDHLLKHLLASWNIVE